MVTKRDLLNLNKKVFEHFTNESLQLAKELIAMEKALEEEEKNAPGAVTKPILEVNKPIADRLVDPPVHEEVMGGTFIPPKSKNDLPF